MVKITYIEAGGTEHVVDVAPGRSVMEGAVKNNVPGILADCGGACTCGTCCIYVGEAWWGVTGGPSEMEEAMLELNDDPAPRRRLSCQIKITDAMNGLVVSMPESQF